MGRQLRRVPMDFDWPLNQVWKGYISPYRMCKCSACCNHPMHSPEYWDYSDYNGLYCGMFRDTESANTARQHVLTAVTAENFDDLARRFRERLIKVFGEDCRNKYYGAEEHPYYYDGGFEKFCELLAIDDVDDMLGMMTLKLWRRHGEFISGITALAEGNTTWCRACLGTGGWWLSKEIEQKNEEFYEKERYEPPTGDGFQLWETTSEGSPTSPIFETIEALCEWCAQNATTFARFKASAEQWREMLDDGFVCHTEGNITFM
jgi:hypothetical protein